MKDRDPEPPAPRPAAPAQARGHVDLGPRILSVSATMVGVCLTVIGLVRVSTELKKVQSVADNILAFNSIAFLATCLLAYSSIRTRNPRYKLLLEQIADVLFLVGLVLMVVVSGLVAYEIM